MFKRRAGLQVFRTTILKTCFLRGLCTTCKLEYLIPGSDIKQLKKFEFERVNPFAKINFVEAISGDLKEEQLTKTLSVFYLNNSLPDTDIGQNILYVRTFYSDLFKKIRSFKRCLLLGNPGVGKSLFQYYYLLRLFRPEIFGKQPSIFNKDKKSFIHYEEPKERAEAVKDFPPDCFGNTQPPKVVIRQRENRVQIYYINEKVMEVLRNVGIDLPYLIGMFNPKTTLYMFEPGSSLREPEHLDLSLPIFTTVSPNIQRYKEFVKHGAIKLFMPTWSLEDLLAIGANLLNTNSVPDDMKDLYQEAKIKERFNMFGGILRHVLPNSKQSLEQSEKAREREIYSANAEKLLSTTNIEDPDISDFILKYNVSLNPPKAFIESGTWMSFVSKSIISALYAKLKQASLASKQLTLIRDDESTHLPEICRKYMEEVVLEKLVTPCRIWEERVQEESESESESETKTKTEWKEMTVIAKKYELGTVPTFDEMEENVVYYSSNPTFPLFDMIMKKDTKLLGFQVTRALKKPLIRHVKDSQIDNFLTKIKLDSAKSIIFYLVPRPFLAASYQVTCESPHRFAAIRILKLPKDYDYDYDYNLQKPAEIERK